VKESDPESSLIVKNAWGIYGISCITVILLCVFILRDVVKVTISMLYAWLSSVS
jgi:uncharacterized integral membrane protein